MPQSDDILLPEPGSRTVFLARRRLIAAPVAALVEKAPPALCGESCGNPKWYGSRAGCLPPERGMPHPRQAAFAFSETRKPRRSRHKPGSSSSSVGDTAAGRDLPSRNTTRCPKDPFDRRHRRQSRPSGFQEASPAGLGAAETTGLDSRDGKFLPCTIK